MTKIEPQQSTKEKVKRIKKAIAMPDVYWKVLEGKRDGVLIRTYGDAIISLLDHSYATK